MTRGSANTSRWNTANMVESAVTRASGRAKRCIFIICSSLHFNALEHLLNAVHCRELALGQLDIVDRQECRGPPRADLTDSQILERLGLIERPRLLVASGRG